MVLQHAGRPQPQGFHFQRPHPNPARIAGIAGAVVLNLAVLMALMLPTEIPLVMSKPATVTEIVELDRKKVEPTPAPPERVEIVKRDPVVRPQPERQAIVPAPDIAPAQDQVLVDQGTLAADPPALLAADASIDIAPTVGPVPGVKLQYAAAPAPKYPLDQMKNGVQGTVLLQVLVNVDGKPLEVTIHQSSGDRQLDRAAQQQVLRKWTFRPAMKDGRAVQAIGIVPIDFKLG